MSSTSFALTEALNSARPRRSPGFFMPFADVHLDSFEISQDDIIVASEYMDLKETIAGQARIGTAVTAFYGHKPVASFGLVPIWPGLAQAWLVTSDECRAKPIYMTRMAALFFDIAEISERLHRTQITVKTSDKRALNWALHLRFVNEGVMRKYGPDGSDHFMMARYK